MDIRSQLAKADYAVTVCSIAPFQLRERKPGLYPGEFYIPACKDMYKDVEYLVIDESRFYVYLDLERGSFPVRASAEQIGVSIINDYVNAQLAVADDCYPGLFLVPHRINNKKEALESELIPTARAVQLRWFEALVKMADDDWEKYRQHRAISHIQREAARAMNLERDWLIATPPDKLGQMICLVCRTPLQPETIMCPNCGFVVNPEEFAKISDRFVKPVQQVNTKVQ